MILGNPAPVVVENPAAAAPPSSGDVLPEVNTVLKTHNKEYKLNVILGDGGYGTVFQCDQGDRKLAVKTEKYSKSMLHIEVTVLRAANAAHTKHFCELVDYGSMKPDYVFVVMTLLGKDLHRLRAEQPQRKFSISTAIRVGLQSAQALRELHSIGYISRDVKPGNFAAGLKCNKQNKLIFLIDFGLAKKYVDRNMNIVPTRGEVGWRGTTRYGSLNAHQRQDLSRRDDMESWFYMLVEITRGQLPWRLVTDRAAVWNAKTFARVKGRQQLMWDCPKQFDPMLTAIDKLGFEDEPDYVGLIKGLEEVCAERQISMTERWDWEDEEDDDEESLIQYTEKTMHSIPL